MAKFTPKKIVLDEINYGNQFRDGDGITTEAINAPIEASAFAQAIATNPPDYTKAHLVGNPKVTIGTSSDGTPRLVFENLKGDKGEIPAEWGDAIKLNSKKISNLEAIISNDAFISDSSVAYQKSVPSDVAPYAAIDKIGGMTYRDGNTLKHAKVKAIKSKGANLWNPYVTEIIKSMPSEVRDFREDVWYQGLTAKNIQASYNVSNVVISDNKVSFHASAAGWGMARAFKCKPNTLYRLTFDFQGDSTSGCEMGFYDANGNWLSYDWDAKDTPTPDNCYWLTVNLATNGSGDFAFSNIQLVESDVAVPYTPYVGTIDTFTIPEVVQALDGYGEGSSEDDYNYIEKTDDERWLFHNGDNITDITDLMPIDNYIKVEGGGTIIADNEYEYDVPTTITYQKRG